MTTIKESLRRTGQTNDHIKVVPKNTNDMESLNVVLELILMNYKINYVVEQVEFNGTTTMYRLKKRQPVPIIYFGKGKTIDEYEYNSIGNIINFPTPELIESYLRLQYSEPEGFKTNIFDLK